MIASPRRRGAVTLALGLLVSLLGASCSGSDEKAGGPSPAGGGTTPGTKPVAGAKPNVLFVLTDDMRYDDLQYMPQTRKLVGDAGLTFDAHFDNVTLCCPARTSILRGQYSHNTGILTNGGDNGGFETAYAEKVEESTIATALHGAGYRTGLFGKYLNGYPNTASDTYVPPGWDAWSSSIKGNAYGEYNYTLNENGKAVSYGTKPEDYGTDVYMRQTRDFMAEAGRSGKPFFAYLAVYAPHSPATPAPQDETTFPDVQAPRDPAFNEADVSDKPKFIQNLTELDTKARRQTDALARRRAQSLQAVDRGVASLIDSLTASGQLGNTYIVFTSDNGFHLGQHRLRAGKQTAYETDIHLPLLVRGPGVAAGKHATAMTGNIDLAPTFAELGGTSLAHAADGRSLVPFLTGGGVAPASWRNAYLLEHWTVSSRVEPRPGAAQLEPDDLDQGGSVPESTGGEATSSTTTTTRNSRLGAAAATVMPEFAGLRVPGYTYVEYVTGERELYDNAKDPDQLDNIASSGPADLLAALHDRLEKLRTCAGDACRAAEVAPFTRKS